LPGARSWGGETKEADSLPGSRAFFDSPERLYKKNSPQWKKGRAAVLLNSEGEGAGRCFSFPQTICPRDREKKRIT